MSEMSKSSESIRLELSVNGEVVATAGLGAYGVLTSMVSWVKRSPDAVPDRVRDDPDADREEWLAEEILVDLGGLDSVRDEQVRWVSARHLKVGDEVVIRVLPPGAADDAERTPQAASPG